MSPVTRSMKPSIQCADPGRWSLADIPGELRLMIYDAINEPRLVEIRYSEDLECVWSPTPGPMGLQICRESRAETMRHCEHGFSGLDKEAHTWFDFRCDAMYFSKHCITLSVNSLDYLISHFPMGEVNGVTHLALDYDLLTFLSKQLAADVKFMVDMNGSPWDAHLILFPEFHHLEKLSVVMDNRMWSHGWDVEDIRMVVEMCERARDERGNWKFPAIGRVRNTDLSTWIDACHGTGVKDISVFMAKDPSSDEDDDESAAEEGDEEPGEDENDDGSGNSDGDSGADDTADGIEGINFDSSTSDIAYYAA